MHKLYTDEALATKREQALTAMNDPDRGLVFDKDTTIFGCDGCDSRHSCVFVYDTYNVNGDCLAGK